MNRKLPTIWYFLLTVILVYGFLALGIAWLLKLPDNFYLPDWLSRTLGGFLIIAGIFFWAYAVRYLSVRRAFGTEINTSPESSSLITSGPYAYVRNPLYFGAAAAIIGFTILLRSVPMLIITILMIPHFYFIAKWEERELLKRFGKKYEEYMRLTPLFFFSLRKFKNRNNIKE
jgi:protein-S-isoprenylcysteine O-methyltransferase Ste14